MTLNQLRVFRAVAATRNIAAAAKSLFMTQPSVSMQLRALEKDVRIPLYERRHGQVILTDAGHLLLKYAETTLQAEEEATSEISILRGTLRGRLRVGTNVTGGMYVTPGIIREYRRQFPEVEVSLAIETAPRVMDAVIHGVVDIGLIGGPVDRARFDVEQVGGDELVLIASPFHKFARSLEVSLEDLGNEALIFPGIGSRSRWLLESRLKEFGFPVRVAMTMNGTEEVKKAVEANLGVGFVSRFAIRRETADGSLAVISVRGFRVKRDFELFCAKGQGFRDLAEPIVRIAKEYFSQGANLRPEPGMLSGPK